MRQSISGASVSGDLGTAQRRSFSDKEAYVTKLGAAIREDMNTNLTYIVNSPALTIICDDISKTCHEL